MWEKGTIMSDIRAILGHWWGGRSRARLSWRHRPPRARMQGAAPQLSTLETGSQELREHPQVTGKPHGAAAPILSSQAGSSGPKRRGDLPGCTSQTGRARARAWTLLSWTPSSRVQGGKVPWTLGGRCLQRVEWRPQKICHLRTLEPVKVTFLEKGLCRCDHVTEFSEVALDSLAGPELQ